MDFRTRRILFGTPFFMIYEFFTLKYLSNLFVSFNDLYLIPVIILLEATRIIPTFTERNKSTKMGRFLSTFYGVYEWFLVMFLFYLILMHIIGLVTAQPRIIYVVSLGILILIGVYAYIHAHKIIVKKRILEFDDVDAEYNIIHLSDVHFGSIRHKEIIEDIADNIRKLQDNCDIAVISGDLADGSCVVEENDFNALKDIDIPVIFTSGNHDYYPGLESVHRACENANIIVLENEVYEFKDLNIYGLSYSFGDIPMPTLSQLKEVIKEDKINIINYHVPYSWDEFSAIGFDIQLSGHTHGGQFYPVTFFGKLLYEGHNMGLFKKSISSKNRYLHVTTGVGSMDIPMRWGTDSEMVILKIVKSN